MTERVEVCAASELPPGERQLLTVAGTAIGVFNVDGELYAVENRCAHLEGPVCDGSVERKLDASHPAVGERVEEVVTETPTIACPWHGWEYELATGVHVGNDEVALRTFDASAEEGTVYVEV